MRSRGGGAIQGGGNTFAFAVDDIEIAQVVRRQCSVNLGRQLDLIGGAADIGNDGPCVSVVAHISLCRDGGKREKYTKILFHAVSSPAARGGTGAK
jgi:hypothetical protein